MGKRKTNRKILCVEVAPHTAPSMRYPVRRWIVSQLACVNLDCRAGKLKPILFYSYVSEVLEKWCLSSWIVLHMCILQTRIFANQNFPALCAYNKHSCTIQTGSFSALKVCRNHNFKTLRNSKNPI